MVDYSGLFHITEGRERGLDAFAKAPADVVRVAERIGFRDAGLWKGCIGRTIFGMRRDRIRRWFVGWRLNLKLSAGSVCLVQYPNYSLSERSLLDVLCHIHQRGVKLIGLVHDIGELRTEQCAKDALSDLSQRMFSMFDVLIVHNRFMRGWLVSQGLDDKRMVELGAFDYLSIEDGFAAASHGNQIVIAGNLEVGKAGYLADISSIGGVDWRLYGAHFTERDIHGQNISYCGSYSPEVLPSALKGSYGLVWDGSSVDTCKGKMGRYLRYNNPHKFSLYLHAGLPVIVWEEAAVAEFVRKNGVGLCVSSLRELPQLVRQVTAKHYEQMKDACCRVAGKLRAGGFVREALTTAVSLLERY